MVPTRVLAAAACIAAASVAPAHAASTFGTFTSETAGVLDGVAFTVSGANNSTTRTTSLDHAFWEFAGSQQTLRYSANSAVTITFDSAITGLELYAVGWRRRIMDGYERYDLGQSFTLNDDFGGGSVDGTELVLSDAFASGIIRFTGPVTSITFGGLGEGGSDSVQSIALAGSGSGTPAVPGIGGGAAMLAVGLGRSRRRR